MSDQIIPTMAMPEVAAQVVALTERLSPTDARLNYVADLLKPMIGFAEEEGRNAFYAASRLLGTTPNNAKHIVGNVARRGSAEAFRAWRAGPCPLPVFEVPALAPHLVGFVYFANPVSAPNVVKIGISPNLVRRMSDLEGETGEEHVLQRWFVGTTLDEAVAQFALAGRRISGKWFATGEPGGQIPGFIAMGVEGMRAALGPDLQKGRAA
ncbi:hypothetical protein ABLE91_05640 [Aquabacter sp. CN5-332]|uniref:hypothetical protein n=1 Tax=Aquabacter sp. CN5-332 TaxID=3156608 RepID=UPI0032B42F84